MASELKMDPQETTIQGVLAGYLASRRSTPAGEHLDHDSFAAFTEGTLSKREAEPVVSHLVECNFCRNITAELIRLDLKFATESTAAETRESAAKPSAISEVLSGLLTKMFGHTEDTVFAHQEDEEKDGENEEREKD